jgi:hypothetical protein
MSSYGAFTIVTSLPAALQFQFSVLVFSASPSLWEGRRRGFASRRGGALRERVEGRELRVEQKQES